MVSLGLSVWGGLPFAFMFGLYFVWLRVQKKKKKAFPCEAMFGIILLYLALFAQFYLVIEMKAVQITTEGDEMMLANNHGKQKKIF